MLNLIHHGVPNGKPPLLIVHGLYGSGRNWGVIAKRLSVERPVIAVDMRNHGNSPWFATHSYHDMASDLAEVVERLEQPADVLGHSMGGKAAMVLALARPESVNRLIVADIAPVSYGHSQIQYIDAMQAVDLSKIERRSDAQSLLEPNIDDPALIPFFLQSLDVKEKRWRLNLETLRREMPKILAFPDIDGQFNGPTLFLTGGASHYVTREHRAHIADLFPHARFVGIPKAGHWLHAEKPREFEAAVRSWLSATDAI